MSKRQPPVPTGGKGKCGPNDDRTPAPQFLYEFQTANAYIERTSNPTEDLMPTILRIDASSRAAGSVSRALGDYFEAAWLAHNPRTRVIRRDVIAEPIGHIAERTITGFYTPDDHFTDDLRTATAVSDLLIDKIQQADVLLLTVPMYNFSLPSALKAWIDHVVRIGRTFSYDESGFTGLVTNRRAYVLCAYGAGGYLDGGPITSADFVAPYLRFILNFLGVQDVLIFAVEGTVGDESALAGSIEQVQREIDAAIASATSATLAAA